MTDDGDALPAGVARYDLDTGPSFRWVEATRNGDVVAVEVQWLPERGLWARSIGPPSPPGTPPTPGRIPRPMPEQWEVPTPATPPEVIVARHLRAAADTGAPAGEGSST